MTLRTAVLTPLATALVLLAACEAGSLTDPTAARGSDGSLGSGEAAGAVVAAVRVRCEVRSDRSKISVDGRNLRPAGGSFAARAMSGANTATAPAKAAIGDEAEFDFDSDRGDIAAGAVAISPAFITGDVTGQILDGSGAVVASATVSCQRR